MKRLELIGIEGIAEVSAGDSVGALICEACSRQNIKVVDEDVVVVAHKIVSKAEGQVVYLNEIHASDRAIELARELDKEPALVEVILRESRGIVKTGGRALIVETHHGFICANAGVDQSNVGLNQVVLLPKDPDGSAREIRREIHQRTEKNSRCHHQRQLWPALARRHGGCRHRDCRPQAHKGRKRNERPPRLSAQSRRGGDCG